MSDNEIINDNADDDKEEQPESSTATLTLKNGGVTGYFQHYDQVGWGKWRKLYRHTYYEKLLETVSKQS